MILAVVTSLTRDGEAGRDDENTRSASSQQKRENEDEEPTSEAKSSPFLRVSGQRTRLVAGSDFVDGFNLAGEPIEWGTAFRAELGWQTSGSEDWHHLYNFPSYGVGFYTANFGSDEIGTPVGAYGFFEWPFWSLSPRAELATNVGLGATFGWEEFDFETNPFNDLIGSNVAFYIDWGLVFRYFLTDRIDLYAGASWTHFSNGGTRRPNVGLNSIAPLVGIQYRLADRRSPTRLPTPKLDSRWGLALWGAYGWKNIFVPTGDLVLRDADPRESFGVVNLSGTLLFRLHPISTVRGGVDLTLDDSVNAPGDTPTSDELRIGLYIGHQLEIADFRILVDTGYYVWQAAEIDQVAARYLRFGLDYEFFRNLFTGLHVRLLDFRDAESLELTVGYRFDFGRRQPAMP